MKLYDDYLPYTDQFGLIQPNTDQVTGGNGLLYSAQAIVAWHDHLALDSQINKMWENVYKACEKLPGLLIRAPKGKDDQGGPDDYTGAGMASVFIDNGALAKRILDYGYTEPNTYHPESEDLKKRPKTLWLYRILKVLTFGHIRFVYNNPNPNHFTQSAWLGRFPALIAHLKYAAQYQPHIIERLWWSISLLVGNEKKNHDGWILDWCRVRTWEKSKHKGWIERLAVKLWRKKFAATCGNPGKLLGEYFQNPNHPNAVYLKNSV